MADKAKVPWLTLALVLVGGVIEVLAEVQTYLPLPHGVGAALAVAKPIYSLLRAKLMAAPAAPVATVTSLEEAKKELDKK